MTTETEAETEAKADIAICEEAKTDPTSRRLAIAELQADVAFYEHKLEVLSC